MIDAPEAVAATIGGDRSVAPGLAVAADARELLDVGVWIAGAVGAELGRLRAQASFAPPPATALPPADWPDALRRGKAAAGIGVGAARAALDAARATRVRGHEPGEERRRDGEHPDEAPAAERLVVDAALERAVLDALGVAEERAREAGLAIAPLACLLPGALLLVDGAPCGARCTLALLVGPGGAVADGGRRWIVLGYDEDRLVASGEAARLDGPLEATEWSLSLDGTMSPAALRCACASTVHTGVALSRHAGALPVSSWRLRPGAIRWA